MTGNSDLLDLAQRVVDRARTGEQVEAFATHGIGTSVTVFDGEVETLSSSETRGVGVRVILEGRLGFASTSDVSDDGLAYALEEARSNAAYGTADVGNVLPLPRDTSGLEPMGSLVADGFDDVPTARKVAMAVELERLTRAADSRVTGVAAAVYGDGLSRGAVASTTGVSAAYSRTDAYAYVSALARPATRRRPASACRWAVAQAISTSRPLPARVPCARPGCSARPSPGPLPCRWCSTRS